MLFAFSSFAQSDDLGSIGTNFPIKERNIVDYMQDQVREKSKNGGLEIFNQELETKAKKSIERPTGLILPRASAYKATAVSPEFTLPQNITDADGNILYMAGTKVNPLKIKPLTKTLCFVNGDDKEQLEWLKTYCTDRINNKLILTSGDFLRLSEQLKLRLYFDSNGYLVGRFGINALPAVVRQNGEVLYVEEFPLK